MQIRTASTLIPLGVLLCVVTLPSYSQTAQLTGRTTDSSGGVIQGAKITVTNLNTGAMSDLVSNSEGYYTAPLLPLGNYKLLVEAPGLKSIIRTGIKLNLDDNVRIDFVLEPGAVTTAITVEEPAQTLETETPTISTAISTRDFDNLPILQLGRIRNPATFIYLAPGVQGDVNPNGTENSRAVMAIGAQGSPLLTTQVLVDGLPGGYSRTVGSITETAPPVDAVREFKVISSQMSAEYGATGSSVVSLALKSGTNELHGGAYEYLRNDKLDARSWFAATRAINRQNEFGFTVGGPVMLPKIYKGKDRTFFFVSLGKSLMRGALPTGLGQVPTPQETRGDFSDLRNSAGNPVLIYDPGTTTATANGGYVRNPFPNNMIPASLFDPVAVKVAGMLPKPNYAAPLLGSSNNFQGQSGDSRLDPLALAIKVDENLAAQHRFSFAYNGTRIPRETLGLLSAPLGNGDDQLTTGDTLRFSYDYLPKPNLYNELKLGFNRFGNNLAPIDPGCAEPWRFKCTNWPQQIGLTGVPGNFFPYMTFSGGYLCCGETSVTTERDNWGLLRDTVSWFHGEHTVKMGLESRRPWENSRSQTNSSGTFNFNSLSTDLPSNSNSTGNSFASFLLGQVYSASVAFPVELAPRGPYWGMFLQDDIKVSQRFTLNVGLRFEFEQAPYEAADRASVLDLSLPNPGAGGLPGAQIFAGHGPGRTGRRTFTPTDYSGFGPRIGFAWQVLKDTVIRAGYGIYYAENYLVLPSTGFSVSGSFTTTNTGVTPAFLMRDGFPQNFIQTPTLSPSISNGQAAQYVEPTAGDMPRIQNWSFSIQHLITPNLQFEASYMGNHTTRQVAQFLVNMDEVNPQYLSLGSLLFASVNSAQAIAAGISAPYPGFSGSVAQALRPYPQFSSLASLVAKAGNAEYDALTLGLKKRFSAGLSGSINYTFSKSLGYAVYGSPVTTYGADAGAQDNYNRRLEHGLLPYDIPRALQINYVYDLPFGPGQRLLRDKGVLGKLVQGWSISGIQRYQSGFPLLISMNNSLPIFNNALRPDLVSGVTPDTGISNADFNPAKDRVINLSAFQAPAPFHFGTAPRSLANLRNFPVLNENFSLIRKVAFTERVGMQIYGQVLNAFNRHRFTGIGANFSAATFGAVSGASNPRYVQLGLRLSF